MMKKGAIFAIIFLMGIVGGVLLTAKLNLSPTVVAQIEEKTQLSQPKETYQEKYLNEESPFAKVAEEVMPSVVNIQAEQVIKEEGSPFEFKFEGPFEEFFKKFFEFHGPRTEKRHVLGSGFIFLRKGDDYFILTNYHVIKGAEKIIIKLSDRREFKGDEVKIVGTDKRTDLAVLKIRSKSPLPVARLGDSDDIKVGDWAIAIGNPFGLERTVTVGVISAKGRSGLYLPEGPDYQDFIQTDAAINRGNSGGPLINIKGEVIGINTAITSPSGGFVGIGFAIPINLAKYVTEQLIEKGKVVRGYLGVRIEDVTPELAEAYNLERPRGAIITEVVEGTPADKAGLKAGDIIVEFNGREVEDMNSLRIIVAETPPGTKVKIKVIREGGKEKEFTVRLTEYPGESVMVSSKEEVEWLGMKVVDISSEKAKPFEVEEKEGVVVIEVEEDSPAKEAEIGKGNVIRKVEDIEIKSVEDFKKAKKKYGKRKKPIIFYLRVKGRAGWFPRIVAVRPD